MIPCNVPNRWRRFRSSRTTGISPIPILPMSRANTAVRLRKTGKKIPRILSICPMPISAVCWSSGAERAGALFAKSILRTTACSSAVRSNSVFSLSTDSVLGSGIAEGGYGLFGLPHTQASTVSAVCISLRAGRRSTTSLANPKYASAPLDFIS